MASDDEPAAKMARMGRLSTLSGFQLTRVLRDVPEARLIALLGTFEGSDGDQAVVVLQQKAFETEKAGAMLAGSNATIDLHNDVYTTYALSLMPEHCQVSCSVTYPCTDKHIQKWAAQNFRMVRRSR